MPETTNDAPVVFISYSHDSKNHKAWVANLATRLRQHHVDVILDQWDLALGDDVPKFMEKWVKASRYVLMICTEAYVLKANDGKGGAGYEAMVVTGELVRNLGTNKFIPIVRQDGNKFELPVCIGTRLFVNLSEDHDNDEQFHDLLHKIHEKPRHVKPPLGPNPFANTLESPESHSDDFSAPGKTNETLNSPVEVYEKAGAVIASGDAIAWRRFQQRILATCIDSFVAWGGNGAFDSLPPLETPAEISSAVLNGLAAFEPYIAALLAAAESGKDGYADQLGWSDQILNRPPVPRSGYIFFSRFPEAILFVTQALLGGMLLDRGCIRQAQAMLVAKMGRRDVGKSGSLFQNTPINGWVESLNHSCTSSWALLDRVCNEWKWVHEAFGEARAAKTAISAYYLLMNFVSFVDAIKKGPLGENAIDIRMPLCFCAWGDHIASDGYTLFLRQRGFLLELLEHNQIPFGDLQEKWPAWSELNGKWLGSVYRMGSMIFELEFPHAKLPEDLGKSALSI